MPDSVIRALVDGGSAIGTDILYAVRDPSGSPLDRKLSVDGLTSYILAERSRLALTAVTSTSLTFAVPGTYPTVQDAVNEAQKYLYLGTAVASISIAAGRYTLATPIRVTHPQPGKIIISGPAFPLSVSEASFTGVKGDDETMLATAYAGSAIFDCADGFINCDGGNAQIRNILAIRTGGAGGNGVVVINGGSIAGYCMAMHGFAIGFYVYDRANLNLTMEGSRANIASHSSGVAGFNVANRSRIELSWGISYGSTGFYISLSSFASLNGCTSTGGPYGMFVSYGSEVLCGSSSGRTSRFIGATSYGIYLTSWCRALLQQSTEVKDALGYPLYANQGSIVRCDAPFLVDAATSGAATTMIANGGSLIFSTSPTSVNAAIIRSPAVGTVGNANSYSG